MFIALVTIGSILAAYCIGYLVLDMIADIRSRRARLKGYSTEKLSEHAVRVTMTGKYRPERARGLARRALGTRDIELYATSIKLGMSGTAVMGESRREVCYRVRGTH